jgi:alpha-galactosidase
MYVRRGEVVAELNVDPAECRIHAEGWQSWTPTTCYRVDDEQWPSVDPEAWTSSYGGSRPRPPQGTFQADGLLIIDPGTGDDIVAIGGLAAEREVPIVRCERRGQTGLVVSADGEISIARSAAARGLEAAKSAFADAFAAASGVERIRPAPTIWCSWYDYYRGVSESDVDENVEAIADHGLPVDVIQVDDGYQREVGDWLIAAPGFGSLRRVVARIRERGHRAGIWISPFLAATRSTTAAEHPEWLVRSHTGAPVTAVRNWGQDAYTLDVTHPGVQEYLTSVLSWFGEIGIDFFKVDFAYAAALVGRRYDRSLTGTQAYRGGLAHIRSAIGTDAYLLGCGAPLLPSVGMVDAMRVSADTGPHWNAGADLSQPSGQSAELSVQARAYEHGRYWVNDPDCLLLGPHVEHRERRARMIDRYGGLRGLSGRIAGLDAWAVDTANDLLLNPPPPTPFRLT